jgi:hypothetical protein
MLLILSAADKGKEMSMTKGGVVGMRLYNSTVYTSNTKVTKVRKNQVMQIVLPRASVH